MICMRMPEPGVLSHSASWVLFTFSMWWLGWGPCISGKPLSGGMTIGRIGDSWDDLALIKLLALMLSSICWFRCLFLFSSSWALGLLSSLLFGFGFGRLVFGGLPGLVLPVPALRA